MLNDSVLLMCYHVSAVVYLWILQSLSECVHESPNTLIFGIHNGFYGAPPDSVSDVVFCCMYSVSIWTMFYKLWTFYSCGVVDGRNINK